MLVVELTQAFAATFAAAAAAAAVGFSSFELPAAEDFRLRADTCEERAIFFARSPARARRSACLLGLALRARRVSV